MLIGYQYEHNYLNNTRTQNVHLFINIYNGAF